MFTQSPELLATSLPLPRCSIKLLEYQIRDQFATAKVLAGASLEFRLEELRSLTDPEIRDKLEAELSRLPPSIQVVILLI